MPLTYWWLDPFPLSSIPFGVFRDALIEQHCLRRTTQATWSLSTLTQRLGSRKYLFKRRILKEDRFQGSLHHLQGSVSAFNRNTYTELFGENSSTGV